MLMLSGMKSTSYINSTMDGLISKMESLNPTVENLDGYITMGISAVKLIPSAYRKVVSIFSTKEKISLARSRLKATLTIIETDGEYLSEHERAILFADYNESVFIVFIMF